MRSSWNSTSNDVKIVNAKVLVVLHDPFNSVPWAEYEGPPGRYLVRPTANDSSRQLREVRPRLGWSIGPSAPHDLTMISP